VADRDSGRSAKRSAYPDWLRDEFGSLIDKLNVDDDRKRLLRSRWLDEVTWMERKANRARNGYYALRLTTVVGAVLVPALVSLSPSDQTLEDVVRVATWVVSLVVAITAAVEQFFHFGERWRSYRRTAEMLKTEGWLYLQLSGPYARDGTTHADAYPEFALRVEELIQSDVDHFLTEVAVEREKKRDEKPVEKERAKNDGKEAKPEE
jgi:hypothetical protein